MSSCTIPSLSQHLVCLERDDSAGFVFPRGISARLSEDGRRGHLKTQSGNF